ncbi:MAG: hypothetical protein AB7Q16_02340 [Vicinamibacterales bacterium]
MTVARTALIVGLLVAGAGAARLAYFAYWFDTWEVRHVPAPAGVDVPFEEAVPVPSDELAAQAREGMAVAWRLTLLGGTISVAGAAGAWLTRRHTVNG